jgi:hypothetical protein
MGGTGGSEEMCTQPSECPGVETTCLYRSCADGSCGVVQAPAGTTCSDGGGTRCNGTGDCVPCLTTPDCSDPLSICQSQMCVPAGCANDTLDGNETGVDCGGDCAPCDDGDGCTQASDCISGFCAAAAGAGGGGGGGASGGGGGGGGGATGSCLPCGQHGDCESGKYCSGGVCTASKPDGDACSEGATCDSGHCVDGVCCDSVCSSTCVACKGTKTGGASGACLPIPANQDPDNECLLSCNGQGSCQVL